MIEFKQTRHSIRNVNLIEVWVDGAFKAAIYPDDTGTGIRVVSRHVQGDPAYSGDLEGMRSWEFILERR
jgi:hypothetical protein